MRKEIAPQTGANTAIEKGPNSDGLLVFFTMSRAKVLEMRVDNMCGGLVRGVAVDSRAWLYFSKY
ncbi:hypothetical protein GCM10007907_17230 [Chitinimonas prasina]|uniref:Uncharacterized protein n=1 Tax=Chitinimonas prasina TaxID=1434937 RepID=A0ABQ5YG11_9NEIS|nr:hypothetical protein GCM10007907_17230 [Chitinimonas prasina]